MDTRFNTAQLFLFAGGVQAVLLAVAAFRWKTENRGAARTFGGIMLLWCFAMFGGVRILFGTGPPPASVPYAVLHLWGGFALLMGPLIYFHVRTSVDARYLWRPSRLIHLIPLGIHLSLLVPFIFVGPEMRATYREIYLERELYRSFIPGIRIGFVVTACYVLGSWVWIRRFEAHVTEVASFGDEGRVRWLKSFVVLLLTLFFFLGFFTLGEVIPLAASVTMLVFMSTMTYIGLSRPHLFHGLPTALRFTIDQDREEEKYAASRLESQQKNDYLETLRDHFEVERPYLKQELTLREVSEQVGIPYRYVSQVINERLGLHFMDFVNGYRVEAAKALLLDEGASHLSVDGVAAEAGFKSRSAFYTAFKKATGETPGAYRTKG